MYFVPAQHGAAPQMAMAPQLQYVAMPHGAPPQLAMGMPMAPQLGVPPGMQLVQMPAMQQGASQQFAVPMQAAPQTELVDPNGAPLASAPPAAGRPGYRTADQRKRVQSLDFLNTFYSHT